jgi:hypothetical protein
MSPILGCIFATVVWSVSGMIVCAPLLVAMIEVLVVAEFIAKLAIALVTEVNELGLAIRPSDVDRVFLVLGRAHERLV